MTAFGAAFFAPGAAFLKLAEGYWAGGGERSAGVGASIMQSWITHEFSRRGSHDGGVEIAR